jgi:hypothetical protein
MAIRFPFFLSPFLPEECSIPELGHLPPDSKSALLDLIIKSEECRAFNRRYVLATACAAILAAGTAFLLVACLIRGCTLFALLWVSSMVVAWLLGWVLRFLWKPLPDFVVVTSGAIWLLIGFNIVIPLGLADCLWSAFAALVAWELVFLAGSWLTWLQGKLLLTSLINEYLAHDQTASQEGAVYPSD